MPTGDVAREGAVLDPRDRTAGTRLLLGKRLQPLQGAKALRTDAMYSSRQRHPRALDQITR